jgi:hypothetical protein
VYVVPAPPHGGTGEEVEAWKRRHAAGPRVFLVYRPGGKEPMRPADYARVFALHFLSALLAAAMLATARLRGWFGRFLFVVGFGLLAALGEGFYWNHFSFPDDWTAAMAADHLVAWALGGLVLASLVKPPAPA